MQKTSYRQLCGKHFADAVVSDGGIAGLTAALLLGRNGKKVILHEKSRIATGESGQTTAHITRSHRLAL